MPAFPKLDGGPCTPWIDAEEVFGASGITLTDDVDVNDATAAAQGVLFAQSGRQFAGSCIGFVRPCRLGCGYGSVDGGGAGVNLALAGADWWFGWSGGSWGWYGGADVGASCGCEPLSEVKLAGYPITGIKEVLINGEVVPADEYRLDRNRYLVRLNDPDSGDRRFWPSCQDLARPDGANHTWSVEYFYGAPPPAAGKLACAELAVQFYLAMSGSEDCILPIGVTKVTRQGVTIERLVPLFSAGRATGLVLVDAFLSSYNPSGLRRRPAIASPGFPRFPRRTPHGTA